MALQYIFIGYLWKNMFLLFSVKEKYILSKMLINIALFTLSSKVKLEISKNSEGDGNCKNKP